jgi:UDP-glucose 4-epimerase
MMDLRSLFAGKRVLVAGGLGFIGSNLARRLVELGADVLIVDALIPAYGGNPFNIAGIENRVRVNIADVRNESVINHLVQGQDFLFNLVGQVSHIDSMQDPYTDLETNCRAQIALLEACRRYNPQVKIVYTGTRQVYGRPRYLPVDEEHPVEPVDINGVHKMAAEWYHRIYHQAHGLRTVTLRLTNTYGPRMRVKDSRQGFIGWWIHQVVRGREIEIFGTGQQIRDLNYVDDVVEVLLLAAALRIRTDGCIIWGATNPSPWQNWPGCWWTLTAGEIIAWSPFRPTVSGLTLAIITGMILASALSWAGGRRSPCGKGWPAPSPSIGSLETITGRDDSGL